MADYSHEDLHLPIRNPPISGPGVDSLKRRKEDNNNERFTAEKLRNNLSPPPPSMSGWRNGSW